VTFYISAGGRTRTVDVRRTGDRFVVALDGHRHDVDVKIINGVWSMLVGPASDFAGTTPDREAGPHDPDHVGIGFPGSPKLGTSGGGSRPTRSYEVAFSPLAEGTVAVHIDGVPVEVSIIRMRRPGATAASHPADEGPQRVTAPMPGKIVKLLVKPGDEVQPRQGVVVVEAMKMENELRARAAGTVSEVRVTEGASVEAGAILVILE
jgi:biotin carboxyl carrier protein